MSQILGVNEAISRVDELDGQEVTIWGALSLEFEGTEIMHLPAAEREKEFGSFCYQSSISVSFEFKSGTCELNSLEQYHLRHVLAEGVLWRPRSEFEGCGPFGLYPAALLITDICKV